MPLNSCASLQFVLAPLCILLAPFDVSVRLAIASMQRQLFLLLVREVLR